VLLGGKTFGESSIDSVISFLGNGNIRLTTAPLHGAHQPRDPGKRSQTDLPAMPLRLKKLMHGEWCHKVDLRGPLKNTDPVALDSSPDAASDATATTVVSELPQSRPAISVDQATSN
jgi:hypothetical protein